MQSDRRGLFENLWRGLAVVFGGLFFAGDSKAAKGIRIGQIVGAPNGLAGFDGAGQGTSVAIGSGLNLTGGTLSVTSVTQVFRECDVRLVRDGSGNYPLPANVQRRTVVYSNGVRVFSPEQYTILNNIVIPSVTPEWPVIQATDFVTADGYPV